MTRIIKTIDGKPVTSKMLATLALLGSEPRALSSLPTNDQNRVQALRDKGLASIVAGTARATAAGRDLLAAQSAPDPRDARIAELTALVAEIRGAHGETIERANRLESALAFSTFSPWLRDWCKSRFGKWITHNTAKGALADLRSRTRLTSTSSPGDRDV